MMVIALPLMLTLGFLLWARLVTFLYRGARSASILAPRSESERAPADEPSVTILVPARNEAMGLERCLRSVVAQDYPNFAVRLLDDQSTDETLAIARRIASATDRLTVLTGKPRPAGWIGKPWALHQLAQGVTSDYLVFVDADIELHPQALRRAVEEARKSGVDLLSMAVHFKLESFWQRVVCQAVGPLISVTHPLVRINDPRDQLAVAIGQVMLFRREAYEAIGGHDAVKHEVLEDVALARQVKARGFRLLLAPAPQLASTHYYGTAREIWRALHKNVYAMFFYRPIRLMLATFVYSLLAIAPWIGLGVGIAMGAGDPLLRWTILIPSVGALLLMTLTSGVAAIFYKSPPLYAFSFPLGVLFFIAASWSSALEFHFGRGVEWKGRSYQSNEVLEKNFPHAS